MQNLLGLKKLKLKIRNREFKDFGIQGSKNLRFQLYEKLNNLVI